MITILRFIGIIAVGAMTSYCRSTPPVPTPPTHWRQCVEARDCMELRGFCNSPEVLNQKFEDKYRNFKRKEEPKLSCGNHNFPQWPENYNVSCHQGLCSIQENLLK